MPSKEVDRPPRLCWHWHVPYALALFSFFVRLSLLYLSRSLSAVRRHPEMYHFFFTALSSNGALRVLGSQLIEIIQMRCFFVFLAPPSLNFFPLGVLLTRAAWLHRWLLVSERWVWPTPTLAGLSGPACAEPRSASRSA